MIFASALGIASPLCMYGTIPICAAFSKKGIKDDFLAAFMMSSILLNPQLIIYSTALGGKILAVRIVSCFVCGIVAGLLVRLFCVRETAEQVRRFRNWKFIVHTHTLLRKLCVRDSSGAKRSERSEEWSDSETANSPTRRGTPYFDFSNFGDPHNNDTDANILLRYIKNVGRNIRATGGWFLVGIALSALFQRYVPEDLMSRIFGGNSAWGVLMAATIGVPLYVCGGGTIPLLLDWIADGMSVGSAAAFMITGPATKITNLGALKIALGVKHFALYIAFVILFSLATGLVVNVVL